MSDLVNRIDSTYQQEWFLWIIAIAISFPKLIISLVAYYQRFRIVDQPKGKSL